MLQGGELNSEAERSSSFRREIWGHTRTLERDVPSCVRTVVEIALVLVGVSALCFSSCLWQMACLLCLSFSTFLIRWAGESLID